MEQAWGRIQVLGGRTGQEELLHVAMRWAFKGENHRHPCADAGALQAPGDCRVRLQDRSSPLSKTQALEIWGGENS